MHKVFVYGTLRPKGKEATHRLYDFMMMDAGAYPYIIPAAAYGDSRDHYVAGNVIEVDDAQLKDLDRYEGIDRGLYTREVLIAEDDESGEEVTVYAYVAGKEWPRPIVSGDWRKK
jgi:gamma-glutamylcyclotransferase (GGCT)/AIG2-like uncharacterized protein YtfP